MLYAKITNGEVEDFPVSIDDTTDLQELTEVAFDNERPPLDQFGYELKAVKQNDGSWKAEYVVVADSEIFVLERTALFKMQAINNRNKLLELSDWTQLPDVPIAKKQEWATYRQALRDVPTQQGFPFNIEWPTRP